MVHSNVISRFLVSSLTSQYDVKFFYSNREDCGHCVPLCASAALMPVLSNDIIMQCACFANGLRIGE